MRVILKKRGEVKKQNYPKVEILNPKIKSPKEQVFTYIDTISIKEEIVYIQFMCNKMGYPIGKVDNSYFDSSDFIENPEKTWLMDYKKDLLKRILEDLENKKELTR